MRIMLVGPHATGKSSTCEALVKILSGFTFVPSAISSIAKDMGYNLNDNPKPKQVVDFQWRAVKEFEDTYKKVGTNVVHDRSPLDLLGYMTQALADNAWYDYEVLNYMLECYQLTNLHCDVLVFPEADLEAPIEGKYNRPVDIEARKDLNDIMFYHFEKVKGPKKIIVPIEFQYEDRVKFIIKELGAL